VCVVVLSSPLTCSDYGAWITRVYGGLNSLRCHSVSAVRITDVHVLHRDAHAAPRLHSLVRRRINSEVVAGVDKLVAYTKARASGRVRDPSELTSVQLVARDASGAPLVSDEERVWAEAATSPLYRWQRSRDAAQAARHSPPSVASTSGASTSATVDAVGVVGAVGAVGAVDGVIDTAAVALTPHGDAEQLMDGVVSDGAGGLYVPMRGMWQEVTEPLHDPDDEWGAAAVDFLALRRVAIARRAQCAVSGLC
jgi:hypothetical protein